MFSRTFSRHLSTPRLWARLWALWSAIETRMKSRNRLAGSQSTQPHQKLMAMNMTSTRMVSSTD